MNAAGLQPRWRAARSFEGRGLGRGVIPFPDINNVNFLCRLG